MSRKPTVPRTDAERRAYQRGYNAGLARGWPPHRPPFPPERVIARLMRAMQDLRDVTAGICAMLDEDDDFVTQLRPMVDEASEALAGVTHWLQEQDETP